MTRLLHDIPPDGFTGAIMAVEGIQDAAVLLNGPTGCKYYHGALSEGQLPRESSMDPLQFIEEFYFGQPRVPATYLDGQDYIFGATDKLERILPKVAAKGHGLIAVVNSPGAALIGDDLERFIEGAGLEVSCVAIESTGFSEGVVQGYQAAVIRILERLAPPVLPVAQNRVNLLGLSIYQRHWEGNVAELKRLLGMCGIGVNTVLCAGCSVSEIATIGAAEANVVVHHEYTDALAPWLTSRFQRPMLSPDVAPVGFEATEHWIGTVCQFLQVDPSPALAYIREARQQAHHALSRFNSLTGLPRGATFALQSDGSLAVPLTQWLHHYLGMVPVAVSLEQTTPDHRHRLLRYLEHIDCADAYSPDIANVYPNLVFGGEGFISRYRVRGVPMVGIDIALPASGRVEILSRCLLGAKGALWLLEWIINGLLDGCS